MAVFTALTREDITGFLSNHSLGELVAFEGIASGIENTNYFVDTSTGRFVLTVFERLSFRQLPFYLELMRHLARRMLPVPEPQENRSGSLVSELRGKPAAIVTRVDGAAVERPTVEHCARLGTLIAHMHLQARDFPHFQPNLRGIGWWKAVVPQLQRYVDQATYRLMAEEVVFQESFHRSPVYESLPLGPVHADLFRDNVLWKAGAESTRVGGVIDFYFAGCTTWLYDLAVAINDWGVDPADGTFDLPRARALLAAYHAVRPLTAAEHDAWGAMLRAAALRFWLSRLHDLCQPRAAHVLEPHDPKRFELTLKHRIADRELPWVES